MTLVLHVSAVDSVRIQVPTTLCHFCSIPLLRILNILVFEQYCIIFLFLCCRLWLDLFRTTLWHFCTMSPEFKFCIVVVLRWDTLKFVRDCLGIYIRNCFSDVDLLCSFMSLRGAHLCLLLDSFRISAETPAMPCLGAHAATGWNQTHIHFQLARIFFTCHAFLLSEVLL